MGIEKDHFTTPAMELGTRLEAEARARYDFDVCQVEEAGFMTNDEGTFGYSPDGVTVDGKGLIEIKTVNPAKFYSWLDKGVMPTDHIPQCQAGLWITGREWLDFIGQIAIENDESRQNAPLFIVRIKPDLEFHKLLAEQSIKCLELRDKFYLEKLGGTKEKLAEFKAIEKQRNGG
jgi:hypothetical protein